MHYLSQADIGRLALASVAPRGARQEELSIDELELTHMNEYKVPWKWMVSDTPALFSRRRLPLDTWTYGTRISSTPRPVSGSN